MNLKRLLYLFFGLPAVAGAGLWVFARAAPEAEGTGLLAGFLDPLLRAYTIIALLVVLGWFLLRGLRKFLWRVGRRLAFSYFLIGVLPIPMVVLLVLVAGYILSGFFLGHLYRDAVQTVTVELRSATRTHLQQLQDGQVPRSRPSMPVELAYYRDGKRFAGSTTAPETWQRWWQEEPADADGVVQASGFVARPDGRPTLLTTAAKEPYGVVALYDGDLARELTQQSGVWVELFRSDENPSDEVVQITLGQRDYPLLRRRADGSRDAIAEFFHAGIEKPGWRERPSLIWVEITRPFYDLTSGNFATRFVSASLTASPRALADRLLSKSADVDTFVYILFVTLSFLLFDIYLVAVLMAFLMSFGLSRAVNRLTEATAGIRRGDFATRIAVRRSDQIGALQQSFNRMAEDMQALVAAEAHKETLEKELTLARQLQQGLLPDTLAGPESLRFATHFRPSAAIGGDYYDLLPQTGGRLAVVVADVSGHGLSAGLRMAMVKSALQLLCEDDRPPEEILRRLDRLQRSSGRGFVTATLAVVDSASGELTVTNAGHPPTYLVRQGKVEEILLPSSPLGTLRARFGQRTLKLEPGDVVVWLSDGLIEALDPEQEAFGYERVTRCLEGGPPDAEALRDRLLAALDRHTGGRPVADDLTLVVMAYRPQE